MTGLEEKYKKVIKFHGGKAQNKHLIEELEELIEALNGEFDKEEIIAEIADVQNMINQYLIMNDVHKWVITDIMHYKMNREIKRIEEGHYDK